MTYPRRILAPLFAVLTLIFSVAFTGAAFANSGTDHSGTWSWREVGAISSGWTLQECSAEHTTGCTIGTGGGTSPGLASFWLASPAITGQVDNTWVVARGICSNGHVFGSWVWGAATANSGTNLSYSASNCSDNMVGTATIQVGWMVAHNSPDTNNIQGDCTTTPNLNCSAVTVTGAIQYRNGSAFPAVTTCAYTASGSYSGTTLAVRLQGVTTVPAGGWQVVGPDPGTNSPSTVTYTMGASNAVDGSAQTYYGSGTLSTDAAMTARVIALDSTGGPTCYLSLTLSSNAIGQAATADNNPGTSADAGDGSSCGFSLNPIHYLICLFYPPASATTQWQSRINTLKTEPPLNIMVGGSQLLTDVYGSANCNYDSTTVGNCPGSNIPEFQGPDGAGGANANAHADLVSAASNIVATNVWANVLYRLITISLWVGWIFWAWQRISASFGGKDNDV